MTAFMSLLDDFPARRGGAPVVSFIASPAGHWINGQTIRVNGGIV